MGVVLFMFAYGIYDWLHSLVRYTLIFRTFNISLLTSWFLEVYALVCIHDTV